MIRRITALAAGAILTAALAVAGTMTANAATPGCALVPGTACGSWNAEVPQQPDLDVFQGAAFSGNAIIVYTRSSADKAEDFELVPQLPTSTSVYNVGSWTTATALGITNGVAIEYAPGGVPSGLCISTVNPNGVTAVQLRPCTVTYSKFNPFQVYAQNAAVCDGTCWNFAEVIDHRLLTDPRGSGSIGVVGHRVHVITANAAGTAGQLWGQNGS